MLEINKKNEINKMRKYYFVGKPGNFNKFKLKSTELFENIKRADNIVGRSYWMKDIVNVIIYPTTRVVSVDTTALERSEVFTKFSIF